MIKNFMKNMRLLFSARSFDFLPITTIGMKISVKFYFDEKSAEFRGQV